MEDNAMSRVKHIEVRYYQEYFYVTMKDYPEVGWHDFRNVAIGDGINHEKFKQDLLNDPDGLLIEHDIYISNKAKVPAGTFDIHIAKNRKEAEEAVSGMRNYEYRWRRDKLRHKYAYSHFQEMMKTPEWKEAMEIDRANGNGVVFSEDILEPQDELGKLIQKDIQEQYVLADAEYEATKDQYVEIGLKYPVNRNGEWVYEQPEAQH